MRVRNFIFMPRFPPLEFRWYFILLQYSRCIYIYTKECFKREHNPSEQVFFSPVSYLHSCLLYKDNMFMIYTVWLTAKDVICCAQQRAGHFTFIVCSARYARKSSNDVSLYNVNHSVFSVRCNYDGKWATTMLRYINTF